jgi:hypothetical protein
VSHGEASKSVDDGRLAAFGAALPPRPAILLFEEQPRLTVNDVQLLRDSHFTEAVKTWAQYQFDQVKPSNEMLARVCPATPAKITIMKCAGLWGHVGH